MHFSKKNFLKMTYSFILKFIKSKMKTKVSRGNDFQSFSNVFRIKHL